jgi:hypothetical protein
MTDNRDAGRRPRPPDLTEWVERYGGYDKIDWTLWDERMSAYTSCGHSDT